MKGAGTLSILVCVACLRFVLGQTCTSSITPPMVKFLGEYISSQSLCSMLSLTILLWLYSDVTVAMFTCSLYSWSDGT